MAAPTNQSDSELFIEYALRRTKGRFRSLALGAAVLLMSATASLFLLAAVAADHVLPGGLGAPARMLLRWCLVLGELAIAVLLLVRPLVGRINNLYVARVIEKAHPEFRNDLTAALELSDDRGVNRGTLAAIKRRAAREVAEADVESSVATRSFRLSAVIFAVAAGAFGVYCLLAPKSVLVSIRRVLGDDRTPAPTRTRILAVGPEDGKVVVSGQPVTFTAEVLGRRGPVTLRISRDAGRTFLAADALEMAPRGRTPSGSEAFVAHGRAPAGAGGIAAFEVGCGDARSGLRRLVVLPAPAVRDVEARFDWPAYTGRGVTVAGTGHVEALRARANAPGAGTKVTIRATANFPVASASMIFAKSPPVIMTTQDETMTGEFEVTQTDSYRIAYRGDHEYLRGQSIPYSVKAIDDLPPEVRLTEPSVRIELPAGGLLRLAGEATDDFGLASVELVIRRADGRRSIGLARFSAPGAGSRAIEAVLPVERIGSAGELLQCSVEARDFRPPAGQVGRSKTFEVSIVAPERPAAIETSERSEASETQVEVPGAPGQGEPTARTGPNDVGATGQAVNELLEMARRDARKLEVLRVGLLGDEKAPEAAEAPTGGRMAPEDRRAPASSKRSGDPRRRGDAQADRQRQVGPETTGKDGYPDGQPTRDTPDGRERGEGRDQAPNGDKKQAQGQGDGQASGKGQGQAEGPGAGGGQGQGRQEGSGPQQAGAADKTEGPGAGSKPGSGGNGESAQDQGRERQAPGDGQAEGPGTGEGAGQSKAQAPGDGQASGKGQGQAQAPGAGEGSAQGQGQAPGDGQASGKGQGQAQAPGAGGGQGQGQGGAGRSGATGMHSAAGGGDPNSGSSARRGDVNAPEAPGMTPKQAARLEAVGRVIDEARKRIRGGKVDPELLKELGMTAGQFAAFVERYQSRFSRIAKMPAGTVRPGRSVSGAFKLTGSSTLQKGRGGDEGLGDVAGAEKLPTDRIRKLRQPRLTKVSSEYRKEVEAYFRAISEGPGEAEAATRPAE